MSAEAGRVEAERPSVRPNRGRTFQKSRMYRPSSCQIRTYIFWVGLGIGF